VVGAADANDLSLRARRLRRAHREV
jgi:hypothetical protein